MAGRHADVVVTVRYFAAARSAAGTDGEVVSMAPGTTVDDLVAHLSASRAELGPVLKRCSYLRDGIAVRDHAAVLDSGQTVDVLPPFAGG